MSRLKTLFPKQRFYRPGEVLLEEFLKPMGLSQNKLALNIGVPARNIAFTYKDSIWEEFEDE